MRRSNKTDNALSNISSNLAWLVFGLDSIILFRHFTQQGVFGRLGNIGLIPSVTFTALILLIEYATVTILTDGEKLETVLGNIKQNGKTRIPNIIALVCLGLAAVFSYHYNFNVLLTQFPARSRNVYVWWFCCLSIFTSEILFWISNLLKGDDKGGQNTLR